ncbi:stage 0 sporulation protein [Candidatus Poribacteria bacterium]|nr:stage 0 sporulation protein [Candidatus Poribacteria bacterium]
MVSSQFDGLLDHEVVGNVEEISVVRVKIPEQGILVFDSNDLELKIGDYCVTEDKENEEFINLGTVKALLKIPKPASQVDIPKIVRLANDDDIRYFQEKKQKEIEAREICRKKIKDRNLPMKLVKTRFSANNRKITFYFTSERRVDFRELVKDLAYIFKRRIELRQIGVRDETKMCGGYGCCGLPLCCSNFLKKLGRMEIKMAKEQDMTLTPSKISGVCGRLLCCLRYENEWYHDMKEVMPEVGSRIKTNGIKGTVEELDLFHSIVKVRDESGRLLEIPLRSLMRQKKGKCENKKTCLFPEKESRDE